MSKSAPLLLVLLVVIVSFYPLLFGRFFSIGDIRDVYLPIEQFFHQQLLQGRLPAWMPDAAWGFPVIASAQIGFFYPPLLLLRFLPLNLYLPLLLLAHYLWFTFGAYLFYRRFCLSSSAAALGALSLSLGGFVALHLTHLNIIFALAWLPWQFLHIYHLARHPFSINRIFILALLLGLPFLVGQIQIPLLMALVSMAWYFYLSSQRPRSWPRLLLIALLLTVLTIFISAAQLFPTYELTTQSSRDINASSFDITRANQHSFPLYHLPTILFPRFFANDDNYWGKRLQIEYGIYVGTLPLLISGFLLFNRRKIARLFPTLSTDHPVPFFTALLIISFLLALGSLSPFRLIKLEPSLWVFSAPARWLLFTSFAWSFFVTLGADLFFRHPQSFRSYFRYAFLLIIAFVIFSNIILWLLVTYFPTVFFSYLSPTHQAKIVSLLSSAAHSSVSLLSPYTWLPLGVALILIGRHVLRHPIRWTLGVTAVELVILFSTTTPTLPWSDILSLPSTVASLPSSIKDHQARLYSVRSGGDTGAYFTDPASRANSTVRSQQRQLLVPLTHTQFNLAGIEWPASLDLARPAAIFERLRANNGYELSDLALAQQMNIGAVLKADPDISIIPLDYAPRLELVSSEQVTPLRYPNTENGSFSLNLDIKQPSTLIIRDSFYPGWHATIDHKPTEIHLYQDLFRSLSVPAGQHQITMTYRPIYIYIGLLVSSVTIGSILLWLLISPLYNQPFSFKK